MKQNTRTFRAYEGLFYINYDNYKTQIYENGAEIKERDHFLEQFLFEEELKTFVFLLKKRFPSLRDVKEHWIKDCHILLKNELFYIGTEDNGWGSAIKLLQRESYYNYWYRQESLQKLSYKKYLKGIKECLFELYDSVGIYNSAWTHGTVSRPRDWKPQKGSWKAA